MAESEGEIEYLDEDAEIVQQCVLSTQPSDNPSMTPAPRHLVPLLVERRRTQKRKKKEEDDSEYDPSDDNIPPSPPSPPSRKKKALVKKTKTAKIDNIPFLKTNNVKDFHGVSSLKEQYLNRKKYNIRIPDYDDPLCLPVRAIKAEDSDRMRLTKWNDVCLEHFKHCDMILKPEQGETKSSVRTAVFRNVINKQTGNPETTIWSKTCVENEDGDKKSEIFQCVLPRYKEKNVLGNFILGTHKHRPVVRSVNEVILTKENHKDYEALVTYKPKECLSTVFGLIDKRIKPEDLEDESRPEPQPREECKMYLKELTTCMVCAPCFQASWRGLPRNKRKSLICPICARSYVNVYNLLSHFKGHSHTELRHYKKIISRLLADIVAYHYNCRLCRKQFNSIKALRKHVPQHQSTETFTCEVCNHVINQ